MFDGAGIRLKGWRCAPPAPPRGAVVYLQGIADNRASAFAAIQRLVPRGFEVIAYDGRAQGESEGRYCTYGFYEKRDLAKVLDTLQTRPVALIGTSLGAAIALQTAAEDQRVAAVVAAETFSGLWSIARHRAPRLLSDSMIRRTLQLAGQKARFNVDEVSPLAAAGRIRIPVLLLHGELDRDTPPEHSRQVFAALGGAKELIIVPGAKHDGALNAQTWPLVEKWLDEALK
jgi:alpha-beta hydrolase superfamily lysophospholipase